MITVSKPGGRDDYGLPQPDNGTRLPSTWSDWGLVVGLGRPVLGKGGRGGASLVPRPPQTQVTEVAQHNIADLNLAQNEVHDPV